MLDDREISYDKHEDDFVVKCTVRGEDLPMDILIIVRPEQQIVSLISPIGFDIPEDKRIDVALAVNIANYGIIDGSFDYDIGDGDLRFRMTSSFRESILGKDLFDYMLMVSAITIDHYNDKFLMLAKGMITLEQFAKADKK